MKKLVLFLFILTFCFVANSSAQENSLGVGVEVAIPSGDFSTFYSLGIGGLATYGYEVNPDLMLTLKAGYLSFSGKDINGYTVPTSSVVPVLAGAKYFFMPGETRFYGSVDAGMYFFSNSGSSSSEFGVTPNVGVQFKAGDKMNADVHVGYANVFTSGSTTSWIGLGVGLTFGL